MKQRITLEQLNELTDDQKEKLREWWKPSLGDCFIIKWSIEEEPWSDVLTISRETYRPSSDSYPILSIGQMIEYLKGIEGVVIVINDCNKYWRVSNDVVNGWAVSRDELCDALWEAVKRVL